MSKLRWLVVVSVVAGCCGGGSDAECGALLPCPTGFTCDLDDQVCRPDAEPECTVRPCEETVADVPLAPIRDLDLLFVIDNSGSMDEEQTSLALNHSRLVNVLSTLEGGLPNVHIGVVSTNLGAGPFSLSGCDGQGEDGLLQSAPRGACSGPDDAFISDVDDGQGGRVRNYMGDLSDTFACIARLGSGGCGFEQPLGAMKRALDGSNPQNAGFLRENALLGVVFLTDEDDCSVVDTAMFDPSHTTVSDPLGPLSSFRCFEFGVDCDVGNDDPRAPGPRSGCHPRQDSPYMGSVQSYVDFLLSLKSDPRMVVVAGIIGNPSPVVVGLTPDTSAPDLEPSCFSSLGQATPGVRMNAFLRSFPQRNSVDTTCNADLSDALVQIGVSLNRALGSRCLSANIDLEPNNPGLQFDCTVTDVLGTSESPLDRCDGVAANQPCWLIEEDAMCSQANLAVRIERGDTVPPAGTHTVVRCLVP